VAIMTMTLTIVICIIEVEGTVVIVRRHARRHECLRNLGRSVIGKRLTCSY